MCDYEFIQTPLSKIVLFSATSVNLELRSVFYVKEELHDGLPFLQPLDHLFALALIPWPVTI